MAAEVKRGPMGGTRSWTIRRFRAEDTEAAMSIAEGSREAAQWDAASYRELETVPGIFGLVSEMEGEICGFIIARQAAGEGEVLNLAVRPECRREGNGRALLEGALGELRRRGVSRVFLEVRESNERGIAFYTKHGFAKRGRRTGYYRHPEEAAILMERELPG